MRIYENDSSNLHKNGKGGSSYKGIPFPSICLNFLKSRNLTQEDIYIRGQMRPYIRLNLGANPFSSC